MSLRNRKRRIFAFLLMFILAFSTVCMNVQTAQTVEAAGKAKRVSLKKRSESVVIGGTTKIKVKNAAKGSKITYKSNKKAIAKVSKKGKVTGIKAGTAKISVVVKKGGSKKKLTYKVTVKKPELSTGNLSIGVGKSAALSVRNRPQSASYTWSSSNNNVAAVRNGTVTGKSAGTAVIQVKVATGKASYTLSCNVRVSAVPKTTYTVKFETNGGSTVADQIIIENGNAVRPLDPVKENCVFEGWYADEYFNQFYNFNTPVSRNITLYARWTDVSNHSVTFVLNDGSMGAYEMQVVEHGEKAVRPAQDPARESYQFTGWYTEAEMIEEYDFSSDVLADMTLYAGWASPDADDKSVYSSASGGGTDYSVTDIEVNGNQLRATVNADVSSILVIDFLSKEGFFQEEDWNSESAEVYDTVSVQTPEYCELTNIILPIDTEEIPDEYIVRAVLYDENKDAVSEPYLCIDHTQEYEQFEEKTIADEEFAEKEIINFDEDESNNFGVLADDIIEIRNDEAVNVLSVSDSSESESETDAVVIEENAQEGEDSSGITVEHKKIYTFHNPDQTVEALQEGQKILFASADSEQQYLVKIGNIEKNADGSISVAEAEDTVLTDFYQFLKVSIDTEETKKSESDVDATGVDIIDVDTKLNYSIGESITWKPTDHVSVSGELKGSGSVGVQMAYDVHLFRENYFECSMTSSVEAALNLKVSAAVNNDRAVNTAEKVESEFKAGKIPIPTGIPGLEIYSAVTVPVKWEISGEASFTVSTKMEEGFSYNTNSGRQTIDKKESSIKLNFAGKAEVSAGPKITLGIGLIGETVQAEIGAQVGVKASVSVDKSGIEITDAESVHACSLCLDGEAKWFVKVNAELKYKITKKLSGKPFSAELVNFEGWTDFMKSNPGKFHISLVNDPDSLYKGKIHFGGGGCANKKYRTVVEVYDPDGNVCRGNQITVQKQNGEQADAGTAPHAAYLYNGIYQANSNVNNRDVRKSFVVSDAAQTVKLNSSASKGIVRGNVCDAKTGSPLEGATIQFAQGDVIVSTQKSQADGSFSAPLPDGSYKVEISQNGYIPIVTYENFENSGTKYMETFRMVAGDCNARGGFSGQITDALSGDPVSGVTLKLRSGWNAPDEIDVIKTLTTNEYGGFLYDTTNVFGITWGLKSGCYSLTASKDDYAKMRFNIIVLPNEVTEDQNATMSPVLSDDEYRIVLRWGETPRDLDSHYNAITTSGYREHVYYSNMEEETANLDWDDTTSYGPETITVTGFNQLKNGFTYSVHDFTNEGYDYCTELSYSGAYVTLLHGSEEPRVYHVPVGRDGTVWNVFSINRDGTITDLNTFGYAYDYEVGSDYVNASVRRGTMKFAGMKKGISNKKSNKK